MKVIKSFILDTKNIKQNGESRRLSVLGDDSAVFSLEVKSGSMYYNFQTNLFQANRTRLSNVVISNGLFNINVVFPPVSAGAKYDIYLTAEGDTMHAEYKEVRFSDGSMDINSTKGSNSRLLQKVIYQTLDVTVTIANYSPNSIIGGTSTTSPIITTSREQSTTTIPFTYVFTVTSTRTLSIIRQPVSSDIMTFVAPTVGSPVDIPGENTFPTITGTDTLDGSVSGTKLVLDGNVADVMSVGDRVIASGIDSGSVVTVVALNPDGDNAKEFSVSETVTISDGIQIRFYNRRNYRWELFHTGIDLSKLAVDMKQVPDAFFASQPIIKDYVDSFITFEGEPNQKTIENFRIPGVDTRGIKPLIVRDSTTKVVTTTVGNSDNPIYVTFSEQALKSFGGGTNARIFSYGGFDINRLTGYDVEFSDLAVSLTEVSTTTTAAVNNSTSVPITQRAGIMSGISTVSGIGIDTYRENPTVSSGAGSVVGAGTIVLSAPQTLEDGVTLTFPGAGTVATITGNIKINHVGNEDITLRFDLEKFLTMH